MKFALAAVLRIVLVAFCPGLFAYTFTDSRLQPNAVYRDKLATTPITVSVTAAPEAGITYYVTCFVEHLYPGQSPVTAQLFDDGTHGDVTAGDRVWTATLNFAAPQGQLRLYQNTIDALEFQFEGRNSRNQYVAPATGYVHVSQLGIVREDQVAARVALANDVVASSHVVNIRSSALTASQDAQAIGKRFYQLFADDFDFLTLYRLNRTAGIAGGGVNLHWIGGLNLDRPTARASSYGSAGRLMGVVSQRSALLSREFLHEFGHFFGFYYNNSALDLSGSRGMGFHGNTSDQTGQMQAGDYLWQLASGSYLLTEQAPEGSTYQENNYSPLELYMMGLVPPDAVAPMTFLRPEAGAAAFGTIVTPAQVMTVSMAALQSVYGARYPDSRSSKKLFRGAFVVVSESFATDAELALLNIVARHFASAQPATLLSDQHGGRNPPSFAYATGFKGAMDTYVLDATLNVTSVPASLARSTAENYFESAVTVANQGHSTTFIRAGQQPDIAVSLNPAADAGREADWWLYATTAQGTYWYTLDRGWVFSSTPLRTYAGPLIRLKSYKVLTGALPRGEYEIHFAVDANMDNRFDGTVDSLVKLVVE
jgi:hypothetical protein